MNAEIITVGTELLLGDILNANSQFLARELAVFGIGMLYQSTVGDNGERLEGLLSLSLARSELLLITGGLGPTPDDLTKETVCAALGLALEPHEESLIRIRRHFEAAGREMTPNNEKQALLPAGCTVFPNDCGTAPGCAIEQGDRTVILLPGPPRELMPMFHQYVAPYLERFSGSTIHSTTVGVFGMPESTVAARLSDLLAGANPTVAPYAKEGEVVLRVTARAADKEAARTLCAPVIEEIRSRLGAYIYGVDAGSLQKTVVRRLLEKGLRVATAESCTAGLLSGRLTEVAGASAVFECGIAAYSADIKRQVLGVERQTLEEHGAVSPEVAREMALGARRVSGAELGIGITGVAGPEESEGKPVGTVYIALADGKRVWVKQVTASPGLPRRDREHVRALATSHALDLTRRYLEALPTVMAGGQPIDQPPGDEKVIPAQRSRRRTVLSAILPWRGDTPGELVRKSLLIACLLGLLVFSIAALNIWVFTPGSNQSIYEDLENMYRLGDSTGVNVLDGNFPQGMLPRFQSLYGRNEDILGWVKIDGTGVNYPVVQNLYREEDYYARNNFDGHRSPYGTPYFDRRTAVSATALQTRTLIVHGNNSRDGQMFSGLLNYSAPGVSASYLLEHSVVELNTIYQMGQWQIFAVLYVSTADPEEENNFNYRRTAFVDDADFLSFAAELEARSLFDTNVEVRGEDSLLLLCTDADKETGEDGVKLVIAARRLLPDEDAADIQVSLNEDAIYPPAFLESGFITTRSGATRRPGGTKSTTAATTAELPPVTGDTEPPPTDDTAPPTATEPTTADTTSPTPSETGGSEAETTARTEEPDGDPTS